MYISFDELPPSSRVWVYQSSRELTAQELVIVSGRLKEFCESWNVHGEPMPCSYVISENRFVLLVANAPASGCSIDSSVRAMQSLGQELGIDFFNRQLVAFRKSGEVVQLPLSELKSAAQMGLWDVDTLMYNLLIERLEEFHREWLLPAGNTWLRRYLPVTDIA